VVGHSFGAAVALAYAFQFPREVRGVVAISPIAAPEWRLEQLIFAPRAMFPLGGLVNRLARAALDPILLPILWRAMFLPQAMPDDFAAQFPFGLAGGTAQMLAEGDDALRGGLGIAQNLACSWLCQTPVEVVVGGADVVVKPRHGHLLAALLPRGRLTVVPGVGHMVHHFAPEVVADRVKGILRTDRPGDLVASSASVDADAAPLLSLPAPRRTPSTMAAARP
jgi:pimeloyl-ACP methyl ester carboxylesterase